MSQGNAVAYEGAGARARLRKLAVAVEREEAPPASNEARALLALWWGLVEGRWKFVERFETGGRRYYVAYENPPGASPLAALDPRERQVVALLGSGQSVKAAGYAMGVGPSTVSGLLKATLAKLGMRSRTELVLFLRAAGLSNDQMTIADTVDAGSHSATRLANFAKP